MNNEQGIVVGVMEALNKTLATWVNQKHAETGIDKRRLVDLVGMALLYEGGTWVASASIWQPKSIEQLDKLTENTTRVVCEMVGRFREVE